LADLQWTVLPHKRSPISCRLSTGQGKFAGQRLTSYHCDAQQTCVWCSVMQRSVFSRQPMCLSPAGLPHTHQSHLSHAVPAGIHRSGIHRERVHAWPFKWTVKGVMSLLMISIDRVGTNPFLDLRQFGLQWIGRSSVSVPRLV